MNNFPNLTNK